MRRPLGLFMIAGITAMLASLVVYSALKQREAALQHAAAQTIEIVVAANNLPLGSKIEPASVKLTRWSRDSIPPGSYTDPQAVIGTYVRSSFIENEPIVSAKLFTGAKTAGVMPLLIPAGMRAMSVPVDEVSDVGGFVQPNTRVDVVVSLSGMGGASQKPFSKTVLENVEVLAVDQEIEGDKDKPKVVKVVTLLVNPDEAERLALASREGGSLRLAIRNYEDSKIVLTRGTDIEGLMRAFSAAPAALPSIRSQAISARAEAPRIPTVDVQILRNGKSSESISFIANSPVHASASPKRKVRTASAHRHPETATADEEVRPVSMTEPARSPSTDNEHALTAPSNGKSSVSAAMYVPKPKVIDVP